MPQTVTQQSHAESLPSLQLVPERRLSPVVIRAHDDAAWTNAAAVSRLMGSAGSRLSIEVVDGRRGELTAGPSGIAARARLSVPATQLNGGLDGTVVYPLRGLKGVLPAPLAELNTTIVGIEAGAATAAWHRSAVAAWARQEERPTIAVVEDGWPPAERAVALSRLWPEAVFVACSTAEAMAAFSTRADAFDIVLAPTAVAEVFAVTGAALSGTQHCAIRIAFADADCVIEDIGESAGDASDPSGLILAAVSLMRQAGEAAAAERLHNAWLRTLEDGLHTPALTLLNPYTRRVRPDEFMAAVAERLGEHPRRLAAVRYRCRRDRAALRVCN
jgi:hypothetical protein